jgi:hypothetical protein
MARSKNNKKMKGGGLFDFFISESNTDKKTEENQDEVNSSNQPSSTEKSETPVEDKSSKSFFSSWFTGGKANKTKKSKK